MRAAEVNQPLEQIAPPPLRIIAWFAADYETFGMSMV